jgi:hypothetical protein
MVKPSGAKNEVDTLIPIIPRYKEWVSESA